jgi:hypothetical protein
MSNESLIAYDVVKDGNIIQLILTFPSKKVTMKFDVDMEDPHILNRLKSTKDRFEVLIENVKANVAFECTFELFFETISYKPKDILHRSGKLWIDVGNPYAHLVTLELLADNVVDDLMKVQDALDIVYNHFSDGHVN